MLHRKTLFTALLVTAGVSACTVQRMPVPASGAPVAELDDHMSHMSAEEMRGPMTSDARIDWNAQGHGGLPASNATAVARLKASPRHGEWVKIAWEPGSKDSLMAWVVYPKATGKAPVVVVVHEIFGLSTWVQSVADQVAADGFIAVAPDLLSRVRGGPSTITLSDDSARKLIAGVNTTERNKGIIAVANYAMMLPSAQPKYAVIGYCWGGQTVWAHAVNGGVKG
jgi:carboxymethylenebutenolidase